jgi:hypothetical protein
MPIQQLTVSPQKVAESSSDKATAYSIQRKVLYAGGLYRVFFYDGSKTVYYKNDNPPGKSWELEGTVFPYGINPRAGGVDVFLNLAGNTIYAVEFKDYSAPFNRAPVSDTLSWLGESNPGSGNSPYIGGSGIELSANNVRVLMECYVSGNNIRASLSTNGGASWPDYSVCPGIFTLSNTTGGVVFAKMTGTQAMAFVKNNANTITSYYHANWGGGALATSKGTVATNVKDGFGGYAVTSFGDVIHVVFVESTGALKYIKYDGSWGSTETLVEAGADHPTIIAGSTGKLYVFYVKGGKIWLIKYDGANWRDPIEFWTDQHTYNNPAYLSSNRNVQNGQICLVWTEGTASPYEVWFCTIGD